MPGADLDAFSSVFQSLWQRIPLADRQTMLEYWQCSTQVMTSLSSGVSPMPVFKIVADVELPAQAEVAFRELGVELVFRDSLTRQADRLHQAILNVLTWVYLVASRRHWALAIEYLDEPIEEWLEQHPRATERQEQMKWTWLERRYLIQYETETIQLAGRWGFPGLKPCIRSAK